MSCLKKLKVVFWNCRGISNKITEFKKYLVDNAIDVACICESFLKGEKTIFIRGYNCIVENRTTGRFGGLLILIRDTINFKNIILPETKLLECMGVQIEKTNLILIYLPGQSKDSTINQLFLRDIEKLDQGFKNKFIMGDFNARHKDWNCVDNNRAGTLLYNYISHKNLFVSAPEEHTYRPVAITMKHSTIDFILTDAVTAHSRPWVENIFNSDHIPVRFNIEMVVTQNAPKLFHCYHLANWFLYRQRLRELLVPDLQNSVHSIDDAIKHLTASILKARDLAIPLKKSNKDQIHIDPELKLMIQKRNYHRRRYTRNHNTDDQDQYRSMNRLIKGKLSQLKQEKWSEKLANCTNQNNNIYKLIKTRRSCKMSPSLTKDMIKLRTDDEKANELAAYFAEAHRNPLIDNNKSFTKNIARVVKNTIKTPRRDLIPDCTFRVVSTIIKGLKSNKSPGYDEINHIMLKNIPSIGIEYIVQIFNRCLAAGYFPRAWKIATVISIPKKGKDQRFSSGYRPISLLCAMSKLFERVIIVRLNEFISTVNFLPPEQFGFRQGHSTSHQLMRVHNFINEGLKRSSSIGLIALDIEKAFDSVWYDGLLYKLIVKNCPLYLVKLVNSFLKGRSFSVKVNNTLSKFHTFNFGVPQGSVLSPCLYNIFTSDMPRHKDCERALYADDTALYTESRFIKTIESRLKNYYKNTYAYFNKWKIKVNNEKTQAIFCSNRRTKQLPTGPLILHSSEVEWAESIKYLGFHIDKKLNKISHIDKTLNKVDNIIKTLYPIIHRGSTTNTNIKILIYKLYIRPVLSYACPITTAASKTQLRRLQVKENKILRLLLNKPYDYGTIALHDEAAITFLIDYMKHINCGFANRCKTSTHEAIKQLHSEF